MFIIAQRISTVENADKVLVLDNGRVSGFDTPANLLKTNAIYQDVYNSQTKGSGDFDEREGRLMAQQPKVVKVGPGGPQWPPPQGRKPRQGVQAHPAYVMKATGTGHCGALLHSAGSVFAQLQGVTVSQTLIDSYILPLLQVRPGSTDFTGLPHAITRVALFYACGMLPVFVQYRMMATSPRAPCRTCVTDLFTHMQKLPINYFDTHAHGDIMSVYTNDIDTLRQMISQSLPQLVNTVPSRSACWPRCSI